MHPTSFCIKDVLETKENSYLAQSVWFDCFASIKHQWDECKNQGVHSSLKAIDIYDTYQYQGKSLRVGDKITINSKDNPVQVYVVGLRNEVFGLSFATILVCADNNSVYSVFPEEII